MADVHEGGCLCGAVRYRAAGQPGRAYVCHCTFCQRASGTAFQIPVVFPNTDVEFSGEAPSAFEYRAPEHGRALRLQFCPRCGTRVGLTTERSPGMQILCGGTFDDPNWFEVKAHIFTRSAVGWMAFPPGVPCFEGHTIAEDGTKEQPLPQQAHPWRMGDVPS